MDLMIANNRITLTRHSDIGQENRGWQIDRVLAKLNGDVQIGRLDIEYIPSAKVQAHYGSILDFLNKILGIGGRNDSRLNYIKDMCYAINLKINYWGEANRISSSINESNMEKHLEEAVKTANELWGKEFKRFKEYHVDFPFPSFIIVNNDYRRMGIAKSLYIEGNRWMNEIGMKLHSSTLISPEASKVWDSLNNDGLVYKMRRECDIGERWAFK